MPAEDQARDPWRPDTLVSGRLLKAPESFLDADGVRTVVAEARQGRRDFIRRSFAAAACRRRRGCRAGPGQPGAGRWW